MKKYIITAALAMILVLGLVSCGSKNEDSSTTSSQQVQESSGQEKGDSETEKDIKEESSGQDKSDNETVKDEKEEPAGQDISDIEAGNDNGMNEEDNLSVDEAAEDEDIEWEDSVEVMIPEGPVEEMVPEESVELEIEEGQQGALG